MKRIVWLLGLACLAGCDQRDRGDAGAAVAVPPEITMIPVAPTAPDRDSLPTRIHFDLTRYDWYAHGEPLMWEERAWQPRGVPVPVRTADLRHLGEFDGVDVWAPADADSLALLYIPVSEGYWLTFVPDAAR